MKKRATNTRSPRARNSKKRANVEANPSSEVEKSATDVSNKETLAVLVYLCGDNHITEQTQDYLKLLISSTPLNNIHLVIQHDTPYQATRYVIEAGMKGFNNKSTVQPIRRDVNTGDPLALEEFLTWGLQAVSAEYHVLILSGLGINPRYVRQSLPLETLPKGLKEVRAGKPSDPNEEKYSNNFNRAFDELVDSASKSEIEQYRDLVHSRTFTICHDFSNSGSLQISDLRQVLARSKSHFDDLKVDDRFEMILFHAGGTGFVEVLFELEELARVYVGSSQRLSDFGLPFERILKSWDRFICNTWIGSGKNVAHELSKLLLSEAHKGNDLKNVNRKDQAADQKSLQTLFAADLDTLDEVARSLDALAVALLHSIGDWHVLHVLSAVLHRFKESYVKTAEVILGKVDIAKVSENLADVEFIPAVNLFSFLEEIEKEFRTKLQNNEIPTAFGQRDRMLKLYKLVYKTVNHLKSNRLYRNNSIDASLYIDRKEGSDDHCGLAILLPPPRTQEQINSETGRYYSLSTPSYSRLNFSRRVHWSALIGAMQLIFEKPHALWRVISSMLVDANATSRDAVLSRLISNQSVVSDMKGQFRSLGDAESLTLSIDAVPNLSTDSNLTKLEVRLEPSIGTAVVHQQESRVYQDSLDSIWNDLATLLASTEPINDLVSKLQSLGSSLGEDVIQDLIAPLGFERTQILSRGGEIPHLTVQLPTQFMKFPWELMNDGDGMLCERYAMGRQIFSGTRTVRPNKARHSEAIRVLVIGDPTFTPTFHKKMKEKGKELHQLPSARLEAEAIVKSFQSLHNEMSGVIECKVDWNPDKPVTMQEMRNCLRSGKYDLIHYAGHAYFDKDDGDGSAWVLSDGLLRAREIRNTLSQTKKAPWLIFANACEAGMDGVNSNYGSNDVTGLATACINQGVSGYIAPLWPVDDELARKLAVLFYRELVRERYSVGESLRRARVAVWNDLKETKMATGIPARTALTWSSFVLYGDPTARLLQTLWKPTTGERKSDSMSSVGSSTTHSTTSARYFRSVTKGQLNAVISLPPLLQLDPTLPVLSIGGTRGIEDAASKDVRGLKIELVERNGLRYWRTDDLKSNRHSQTYSKLGELLNQTDLSDPKRKTIKNPVLDTGRERGLIDFTQVVCSWVVHKITNTTDKSLVAVLAEQFDREQVNKEQLYQYSSETNRKPAIKEEGHDELDEDRLLNQQPSEIQAGNTKRILLIIHGTLSHSQSYIADLAKLCDSDRTHPDQETESLLSWTTRTYHEVLAYDHWTLSKTPEQNAQLLLSILQNYLTPLRRNGKLIEVDILCHSRGGLVARELINQKDRTIPIRNVIMVGVPNGGTSLANPENWGTAADFLINQVANDSSGVLGRLSSFFVYMAAQGIEAEVPGLNAMVPRSSSTAKPNSDHSSNSSVSKSRKPESQTQYFFVASNYKPDRNSISLKAILNELGDHFVDKFFSVPNDLVVDTASMWAISGPVSWSDPDPSLDKRKLLLFDTTHDGPSRDWKEVQSGVHHLNYFTNRRVRDFIRMSLDQETPNAKFDFN